MGDEKVVSVIKKNARRLSINVSGIGKADLRSPRPDRDVLERLKESSANALRNRKF